MSPFLSGQERFISELFDATISVSTCERRKVGVIVEVRGVGKGGGI